MRTSTALGAPQLDQGVLDELVTEYLAVQRVSWGARGGCMQARGAGRYAARALS